MFDYRDSSIQEFLPPAHNTDMLFVPYRYGFDHANHSFRICTRSSDGKQRKAFSLKVSPWSYIEIPEAFSSGEVIDRMTEILKSELATDRVTFSPESNVFIVEPNETTPRIRDVAKKIIDVEVETYSVLSRFGQKFFDPFHINGQWATAEEVVGSTVDFAMTVPFRIAIFSAVDNGTIAFVARNWTTPNDTTVYIRTIHRSFTEPEYVATSERSIMEEMRTYFGDTRDSEECETPVHPRIDVEAFETVDDLCDNLAAMLKNEIDVAVHYGVEDCASSIMAYILDRVREVERAKRNIEIFDMRDYIEHIYPDMPSHDFSRVSSEINLVSIDRSSKMPLSDLDRIAGGASVIYLGRSIAGKIDGAISFSSANGRYTPSIRENPESAPETAENVVFCLERIASRAQLMGKTFDSLKPSLFEFMNISGCNLSELTRECHASRGIISFINPVIAYSQIVDSLPSDSMDIGAHPLTYVTPLASLLVDNMKNCGHSLTETVGRHIEPAKLLGWVIREIYSMRALSPAPLILPPDVFGVFRGMIYSRSPIRKHEHTRQWSSVLNIGLKSWIGISMSSANLANPDITFGYFGVEDACRHPFEAVRLAVEMYLSLKICNNAVSAPQTIAMSVALTNETMMMRQKVTSSNVSSFKELLRSGDYTSISNGSSRTISLWFKAGGKLTTNPLLANKQVYVEKIKSILHDTFAKIPVAESVSEVVEEVSEPFEEPILPPPTVPIEMPERRERRDREQETEVRTMGKDRIFPVFN